MGISRSATVVCAYLIATQAMPPTEALDYVISRRSIVCPNLGFRNQLEVYGMRYIGKTSTSRYPTRRRRITNMGEGIAHRIRKLTGGQSTVQVKAVAQIGRSSRVEGPRVDIPPQIQSSSWSPCGAHSWWSWVPLLYILHPWLLFCLWYLLCWVVER